MTPSSIERPLLRLEPGRHKRALAGHPWVYSNEIAMGAAVKALAPGTLVALESSEGRTLGTASFNPHTLIAARILDPDPAARIDAEFFARRFVRAGALRDRLYGAPFYRLVHAEADGLGGLVVDRYGETVVVQITTAGMNRLAGDIRAGLAATLAPRTIVVRRDPAFEAEAIAPGLEIVSGALDGPIEVIEGAARGYADLTGGQKTGWFFDQRDNRAFMARFAPGARALDIYCYTGGFSLQLAASGAREIVAIDSSAAALELAVRGARLNGAEGRMNCIRAEAFNELARLAAAGERFDIVIADPPAFAKSKKDLPVGLKAYRKLARLAAALVTPGGFLLVASCSHNVGEAEFAIEIARGLARAERTGRILRRAGAGPDHPIHPFLPESAYLKAEVLQLD